MPLKNILLDLGNVLFSINYELTKQAFIDLGFTKFDEMYSQFTADELFEKLETGLITNKQFYEHLKSVSSSAITEEQIKDAWNKLLLEWRKSSLDFLSTLSKNYNLYLLSNTNDIHLTAINEMYQKQYGAPSIDHFFTKAYYSNKINLRKPNANVYEFVAQDANIKPEETLFIDDSINNIEAAAALGFKTHLLLAEERIEHLDYSKF